MVWPQAVACMGNDHSFMEAIFVMCIDCPWERPNECTLNTRLLLIDFIMATIAVSHNYGNCYRYLRYTCWKHTAGTSVGPVMASSGIEIASDVGVLIVERENNVCGATAVLSMIRLEALVQCHFLGIHSCPWSAATHTQVIMISLIGKNSNILNSFPLSFEY